MKPEGLEVGAVYARPEFLMSHAWQWMHGLRIGASPARAAAARRAATRDPVRLAAEVAAAAARFRPPPSLPMVDRLGLSIGIEADLVLAGRRRL